MMTRLFAHVPYRWIETGRKLIHTGPLRCRVCGSRIRRLYDSGYDFAVLERLQVVGGMKRPADRCPVCHATARERLIWFYLSGADGGGPRLNPAARIAHFAPEKGLTKVLRGDPSRYSAFDYAPGRYRHLRDVHRADLSQLEVADGSFDFVMANHVIEHVPDHVRALAEIRRVLRSGGFAILQVPISLTIPATLTAPLDATPPEREAMLGQHDHLRLFNEADYVASLEAAGFAVERYHAFDAAGAEAKRWQLDPLETLFICRPWA